MQKQNTPVEDNCQADKLNLSLLSHTHTITGKLLIILNCPPLKYSRKIGI